MIENELARGERELCNIRFLILNLEIFLNFGLIGI